MKSEDIYGLVCEELIRARNKWPMYVNDIIHSAAIINEEAGETIQAALDFTYDNGSKENVIKEAVQTAAMCFRLISNIDNLKAIKQTKRYE